jgi:predicted ribosomally synthesized peptide with nif11-like leader
MSKTNAKAFLKKLMASKELVERCQAVSEEERLNIAAALGFPHTTKDMQAVIDEGLTRAKHRLGELSDKELEQVSGGQAAVEVVVVPVVVLQVLSPNAALHDPLEIDL